MSWCWEMNDGGNRITNGLRFATKEEADAYGLDLALRWTGMPPDAYPAERDDPVTHRIVDGKMEAVS